MTGKEKILGSLRGVSLPDAALPSLDEDWATYDDPAAQFARTLEGAGGRAITVGAVGEIGAVLEGLPCYTDAKKVCSLIPGLGRSDVDLGAVDDPHELKDVDLAVLPGEFGVAENGAVWLTDRGVRHRAICFIAGHLILVLPASRIVHNMHQAYARIAPVGREFGLFLCGPSKTADIEQSLVIGAHGARSLTAVLCGDR